MYVRSRVLPWERAVGQARLECMWLDQATVKYMFQIKSIESVNKADICSLCLVHKF